MQIPAGLCCDRYGPRRCLITAGAVCSLCTLWFAQTNQLIIAETARLLIGAMSACAFIAPLSLAIRWLGKSSSAIVAGCIQVMGCLGAIGAGQPIAQLNTQIGWRMTMHIAGLAGLIITTIFFLTIKDQPDNTDDEPVGSIEEQWQTLHQVTTYRPHWYIGFCAMASWTAIALIAELWGPTFISTKQDIPLIDAAACIQWAWIGMAITSPLAGWWSEYRQSRLQPLRHLLLLSATVSTLMIWCPMPLIGIKLCIFLLGCSAAAQPVTFGLITDHNNHNTIATAIAFNNMALISSAFFLQPITGILLDLAGSDITGFQLTLSVIPMINIAGVLISQYAIEETHCQAVHHGRIPTHIDSPIIVS